MDMGRLQGRRVPKSGVGWKSARVAGCGRATGLRRRKEETAEEKSYNSPYSRRTRKRWSIRQRPAGKREAFWTFPKKGSRRSKRKWTRGGTWDHERCNAEEASSKIGGCQREGWNWQRRSNSYGGGCRRGFRQWVGNRQFRLCSGRVGPEYGEWNYTIPSDYGFGIAQKGEKEKEAKGSPQGSTDCGSVGRRYKRFYFEELERSAGSTSRAGSARPRCETEEIKDFGEEEGCSDEVDGSLDTAVIKRRRRGLWRQGQEEQEGKEKEKEKEKEEEKNPEGWSDRELQRELQHVFGFRRGSHEFVRRGLGDADSQEEPDLSGLDPCYAYQPCEGAVRADSYGGSECGGDSRDGGGEDSHLLHPPVETHIQYPLQGATRTPPFGYDHGHVAERRHCEDRRRIGSEVHGDPPIADRPELVSSSAFGAVSNGGSFSCQLGSDFSDPQTLSFGGKDARVGPKWKLGRIRPWPRQRRTRRMASIWRCKRRCEGQERRKEGRRKRQGKRRLWLEHRKGRVEQMEGYEGEGGREVRSRDYEGVTLEKSERPSDDDLYRGFTMQRCARSCTDLQKAGCILAWLLVHAKGLEKYTGNSKVFDMVYDSGIWHRVGRTRLALPLREGRLWKVREKLEVLSLDGALHETFTKQWGRDSWLLAVVVAINSMYGCGGPLKRGDWTKAELRAVQAIGSGVDRLLSHGTVVRDFNPMEEEELRKKRLNYQGEEVGVCHKLSLEQVLPSLPPHAHGGCISTLDFVCDQTKSWLLNPGRNIVEDVGQDIPKLQGKIHVSEGEMESISDQLISRGICSWISLESVVEFRGQKVLNGLFGVEKSGKLVNGRPVLRLIMNLIPTNAIMRQYVGVVKNLPSITSWMSLVLEGDEEIRIWQSDMCNAFYLFKLPEIWRSFLAFNFKKTFINTEGKSEVRVLACNVLPMGWASSVSIMQEISEQILRIKPLAIESQLVRNRAIPQCLTGIIVEATDSGKSWWHVYLDNFAAGEIGTGDSEWHNGEKLHQLAEECWADSGVLSSEKKRKRIERNAEELGAFIDGEQRTIGGSPSRFLGLMQSTFVALSMGSLSKKLVQVLAGRWVHVMQLRRPAMCILDAVWDFTGGKTVNLKNIVIKVRREFFSCLSMVPLLHTFLGSSVSSIITASDASSTGGAVGVADTLSPVGMDYVSSSIHLAPFSGDVPILVISLFNGIGGAFRVYDILGIRPRGLISFDIHGPANRVTSRAWPHAEIHYDVVTFTKEFLRGLLMRYLGIEEIHLWAGFPCTDLSSANALGKGLEGKASGLFFEVVRISKLLRREVPSTIKIKEALENVASMPRDQCEKISRIYGREPYYFDCVQAVAMHRPRLCWTTETIEGVMDDVSVVSDGPWMKVIAEATYPLISDWIAPETTWPGGEAGHVLPTCMKAIPRLRPPYKPAGIQRCDQDTLLRYEADEFRFPPYQYKEQFIFYNSEGGWRLASSEERELLLGYGWKHTAYCFSASDIKQSKQRYTDERHSLLGDSFSIFSFIIPAVAMCQHFIPRTKYGHLANRMGLAPGFRCPIRLVAPIKRKLQYGFAEFSMEQSVLTLNRLLLSRVNHTGSDIRIVSGEILNPKAHPRQGVQSDWWIWKPSFAVRWKRKEHINLLELRSIFLALRYHITHLQGSQFRLFHISDSYVCLSVVGKGRTGSKNLSRVLRQLNAYLLAHGITLILGHVDSLINPTDGASRSVADHI